MNAAAFSNAAFSYRASCCPWVFFATKPQPSWLMTLVYLTIDTFSPSLPLALAFSVIVNPFLEASFQAAEIKDKI